MNQIIHRISTGWNVRRILYLALGIYAIINGISSHQWILIPLGIYFALMGLLALGCAGNNCSVDYTHDANKTKNNYVITDKDDILHYKEIKK